MQSVIRNRHTQYDLIPNQFRIRRVHIDGIKQTTSDRREQGTTNDEWLVTTGGTDDTTTTPSTDDGSNTKGNDVDSRLDCTASFGLIEEREVDGLFCLRRREKW
jgi:hypothetical protein